MNLSIIVPIFNEAKSLPALFAEIYSSCAALQPFEMICVDDGSTDESWDVILQERATRHGIRAIKLKQNCGKSTALHAGIEAAVGDAIVILDADLQNPPTEIPRLVAALDDVECVIGWRAERRDTFYKRFASRFANNFRRFLLEDGAHDTGCALVAFRRDVIKNIPLFQGMHRFFPALVQMRGHSFREIRVEDRERLHGSSKYSTFLRAFPGFFDLLAVMWMKKRLISYEIELSE